MIKRGLGLVRNLKTNQRVAIALARANATSNLRTLDKANPHSWEFCGFSQNGEDGIIDYLCSQILMPNRFFVEIGAADGIENNTSFLAIAKKYSGLMIEGNQKLASRLKDLMANYNLGVEVLDWYVNASTIDNIITKIPTLNPDVFSLDIDGADFHLVNLFLQKDFRPKIIIVEFNSAFGPSNSLTVPYKENYNYLQAHSSNLYYGVSWQGWKNLLQKNRYKYITTDKNGVNMVFIEPSSFNNSFINDIKASDFVENFFQQRKFNGGWQKQFDKIKHMQMEKI